VSQRWLAAARQHTAAVRAPAPATIVAGDVYDGAARTFVDVSQRGMAAPGHHASRWHDARAVVHTATTPTTVGWMHVAAARIGLGVPQRWLVAAGASRRGIDEGPGGAM
jgi:hypothetical protein